MNSAGHGGKVVKFLCKKMNSITYMYRNENQIKQVNLSIICACHHIVRTAAVLGGNELEECAQCPPHHGVPSVPPVLG